MINNVLFIALVILAVTEVIFAVGFFMMLSKIKELHFDYEFFKSMMKTNREITDELVKTVSEEAETYEHMYELCDLISEQNTKITEQYENILKQYEVFYSSFKLINDNYKKLLEAWKDVTSASDNASEQFRLCTLELKKVVELRDLIQRVLDPWVLDSDQLGDAVLHGFSQGYERQPIDHYWPEPDTETDIDDFPREDDEE